MKTSFAVLAGGLALFTTPTMAIDSPCETKQKNAASFELAQNLGIPVQSVRVLEFADGGWTEATMNNRGYAEVTVRAPNRLNRGMTIMKYRVSAKQIGASDDCTIEEITELASE